jgi:hypothetical protein
MVVAEPPQWPKGVVSATLLKKKKKKKKVKEEEEHCFCILVNLFLYCKPHLCLFELWYCQNEDFG